MRPRWSRLEVVEAVEEIAEKTRTRKINWTISSAILIFCDLEVRSGGGYLVF